MRYIQRERTRDNIEKENGKVFISQSTCFDRPRDIVKIERCGLATAENMSEWIIRARPFRRGEVQQQQEPSVIHRATRCARKGERNVRRERNNNDRAHAKGISLRTEHILRYYTMKSCGAYRN